MIINSCDFLINCDLVVADGLFQVIVEKVSRLERIPSES